MSPTPYCTIQVSFPTKEEYEDACAWAADLYDHDRPNSRVRLRKGVVPIKDAVRASMPVKPQVGRFYELTEPGRTTIPSYYRRVEVLCIAFEGNGNEVLCIRDANGHIYTTLTKHHTFKEVQ